MPNHLPASFALLFLLAGVFAMLVPQAWGNWMRSSVQLVFWPARVLHDATCRLGDQPVIPGTLTIDPKTPTDEQIRRLSEENNRLARQVAFLQTQNEQLRNQLGEQQRLAAEGKSGLVSARVVSVDAGGRDVVRIESQNTTVAMEIGQPVIYPGGVAGRISDIGIRGQASVRLVTDRGNKVLASFGRFENGIFAALSVLQPMVIEGMGKDEMRLDLMEQEKVKQSGLKVGDWVVLADPDWPASMQGNRLGHVSFIGNRQDATGFAEIRVRPQQSLTRLREATVVTQ